jgi:hypothetical protein
MGRDARERAAVADQTQYQVALGRVVMLHTRRTLVGAGLVVVGSVLLHLAGSDAFLWDVVARPQAVEVAAPTCPPETPVSEGGEQALHRYGRWTGIIKVEPGEFRLGTTSGGRVRVWVDGRRVIDSRGPHTPSGRASVSPVRPGRRRIEVERLDVRESAELPLFFLTPTGGRLPIDPDHVYHKRLGELHAAGFLARFYRYEPTALVGVVQWGGRALGATVALTGGALLVPLALSCARTFARWLRRGSTIDTWLLPSHVRDTQSVARARVAIYAILGGATALSTWPLVLHLGDKVAWGLGDPLLNAWAIAWNQHSFLHCPGEIFNPNIFYPVPGVSALTDYQWIPALLMLPVRLLTSNPLAVYNVYTLLAIFLGAAVFFEFALWLSRDIPSSFAGTFLVTFTPYRFAQFAHVQIVNSSMMVLVLFLLHLLIARPRKRVLPILLAIAFVAQYLTGLYHTVFLSFHMPVFALLLLLRYRNHLTASRALLRLGASAGLAAVLLLPFVMNSLRAIPYLHAGGMDTYRSALFRPIWETVTSVHATNRTWSSVMPKASNATSCLFPGTMLLIFGAIGLGSRRFGLRAAYGVLFVSALALADGDTFHFMSRLYPPFRAIRAPGRQAMLAYTALGVAAVYGLRGVLNRFGRRRLHRWIIAGAVACAAIAEGWAVPFPLNQGEIRRSRWAGHHLAMGRNAPEVYRWLANTRWPRVIAELPDLPKERFIYQLYSTLHWKRMVSGFSGRVPALSAMVMAALQEFPSPRSLYALRSLGVDCVIVHYVIGGPRIARIWGGVKALSNDALEVAFTGGGSIAYRLISDRSAAGPPDYGQTTSLPPPTYQGALVREVTDGDLHTAWEIPAAGPLPSSLEFALPEPRVYSGFLLCLGERYRDYPRAAVVKLRGPEAEWQVVSEQDDLFPWLPSMREGYDQGRIYITFPPTLARQAALEFPADEPNRASAVAEVLGITP